MEEQDFNMLMTQGKIGRGIGNILCSRKCESQRMGLQEGISLDLERPGMRGVDPIVIVHVGSNRMDNKEVL